MNFLFFNKLCIGSGLPQLWIESGIYSASVVEKMLAGKQMKRSLEAHTILVLALSKIFITKKIEENSKKQDVIECLNSMKASFSLENDEGFQSAVKNATDIFATSQLAELFNK